MATTKDWDNHGHILAKHVGLHAMLRDCSKDRGMGSDFIDWLLHDMNGKQQFRVCLEELVEGRHEQAVLKQKMRGQRLQVDATAQPLLPYGSARIATHSPGQWGNLELELRESDQHLCANGIPIGLEKIDISEITTDAIKLSQYMTAHYTLRGFNANFAFAMKRYPHMVPPAWKRPMDDGWTPYIVLPGTRWLTDHYEAVATMYWNGKEMVESQLNIETSLTRSHPGLSKAILGGHTRESFYIAMAMTDK